MRFLAAGATAFSLVLVGWMLRQAWVLQRAFEPPPFPHQLLENAEAPSAWVFVRAGCDPCRRHLQALQVAAARLPDSTRARALRRVHVWGRGALSTPVPRHAPSRKQPLPVRVTPTTWILSHDRQVAETWVGARNASAWTRALRLLAAAEGNVP